MAATEVVRDAPPKPLAPVDESVIIPKSVRDAAARADAFYQNPPTDPAVVAAEAEAAEAEAARAAEAQAAAEAAVAVPKPKKKPAKSAATPDPEPVKTPDPALAPVTPEVSEESWHHRYLSMKGRWEASQQNVGSLQEQLTQMGDELMRAQSMIQGRSQPQPQQQQRVAPTKLITPEDEQAFGTELIDLARRAAQEALGPEVDDLKRQNTQLTQQVTRDAQVRVTQLLDREIPNWRDINNDPRFFNWLRLRDVYSGQVRKQMLDAAYRAANAPQVKAFFDGFIRDEAVTGNEDLVPQHEQTPARPAAPQRQAAVALDTLAAPGRAKPASGDTPGPADKPIFTRTQIKRFYDDVRAQRYAGRETEKVAMERQIFSAQNEGRVR